MSEHRASIGGLGRLVVYFCGVAGALLFGLAACGIKSAPRPPVEPPASGQSSTVTSGGGG